MEIDNDGKKTKKFEVISHSGNYLGIIKWYGAWRQYVFFPVENSIFSIGCLKDLENALETIKDERNEL